MAHFCARRGPAGSSSTVMRPVEAVHGAPTPGRIAGRFSRVEPRLWAGRLALGPLSDRPRKNC